MRKGRRSTAVTSSTPTRTDPLCLRLACAVAILGWIVLHTGPVQAQSSSRSPVADWERLQTSANADSVAGVLERWLETNPRHALLATARFQLAGYYFSRGDYPQARRLYHLAAEDSEFEESAQLSESRCYYALGDFSTTRNTARALVKSRDSQIAWRASFLMAQSWQAEGHTSEALAALRRLLSGTPGPSQPAALLAAARASRELEYGRETEELLTRLVTRYPRSPEAVEARELLRQSVDGNGMENNS